MPMAVSHWKFSKQRTRVASMESNMVHLVQYAIDEPWICSRGWMGEPIIPTLESFALVVIVSDSWVENKTIKRSNDVLSVEECQAFSRDYNIESEVTFRMQSHVFCKSHPWYKVTVGQMHGILHMKASQTDLIKVDCIAKKPHLAVLHSKLSNLVLLVFDAKVFYCMIYRFHYFRLLTNGASTKAAAFFLPFQYILEQIVGLCLHNTAPSGHQNHSWLRRCDGTKHV